MTSPAVGGLARAGARAGLVASAPATAYLLLLLATAAGPRRPPAAPAEGGTPTPATTVLVPAHDEELVVAACVAALRRQDVDPARVAVVVIADNCTDATARIAAGAGAEVWVRTDAEQCGKGQALAWALERLAREGRVGDVVGVVDADCIASPGLVRAWGRLLGAGAVAVQADYVIANPEASAAAARRWAGFALRHRVRAAGKERLGASVGLFGTGMAFSAASLAAVPWTSASVTEDVEHHVRLVAAGERVAFVPDAWVASPAPTTEHAARAQQLRWETGNARAARTAVPMLLAGALRGRDARRAHLALELLVPPQSLLAVGAAGALVLGAAGGDRRLTLAAAATAAGQAAFVLGGLALARAPAPVWRSLATAPVLVAGKAGQAARIAAGRGARTWQSTVREPAP